MPDEVKLQLPLQNRSELNALNSDDPLIQRIIDEVRSQAASPMDGYSKNYDKADYNRYDRTRDEESPQSKENLTTEKLVDSIISKIGPEVNSELIRRIQSAKEEILQSLRKDQGIKANEDIAEVKTSVNPRMFKS